MTIIDRPAPHRHRAATPAPARSTPAPLGGRYVTTGSPRTATEGTYVTRWALNADAQASSPLPTRGTYVTVTRPAATSGGQYTFAG